MDIPEEILQKLKCSRCDTYLSAGPVYMQYDGSAVCDCCHSVDETSIRNLQYEATASLLLFPCKNKNLGCTFTYPFMETKDLLTNHDFVCEYRQYVCPLLNSDTCDWTGTKQDILEHCQDRHPTQVLNNSCSFDLDITKSSLKNYLLTAFKFLFILHTKVCITSGKIFHSIRFLGSGDKASSFSYTVGIHRENETLLKKGNITLYDHSFIQESTFKCININSLLDVLGGWDKTVFIITIENNSDICVKCGQQTTLIFCNEKGLQCTDCAPATLKCDCDFKDFEMKVAKHVLNFCNLRRTCYICNDILPVDMTLSEHYKSKCSIQKYKSSFGRIELHTKHYHHYYFCSTTGPVICWYLRDNNKLELEINSSILGENLHKYNCEVRLNDSKGYIRIFKPEVSYTTEYDWKITVDNEDIPRDCQYFNVYIDIRKK